MPRRIVDVREVTKPIASAMRNAYIDFDPRVFVYAAGGYYYPPFSAGACVRRWAR